MRPHTFDMIEKRDMQVAKSAWLGTPVVHLGIDIHREPAAPCRPHILVPYTLKIQGQSTLPAACYHQVSSEIEIQANKPVIDTAIFHQLQSLIGRQTVAAAVFKDYLRPVKITAVVLCMFCQQFLKSLSGSSYNIKFSTLFIIGNTEISLCTEYYHYTVAAVCDYAAAPPADSAAIAEYPYICRKAYTVLRAAAAVV